MEAYAAPIARLIEEFERLPGIGHKTAQRLAFFVLGEPMERAERFAAAITEAKSKVHPCPRCANLTDGDLCPICASPGRDPGIICVVEEPRDVVAMERTHEYKGLYHVLHGVISPQDRVGPDDLTVRDLFARLAAEDVREVVLATNPDVEGEATATYLGRLVKQLGIRATRLAHGIPVGGNLEYADEVTLAKSLLGRQEL